MVGTALTSSAHKELSTEGIHPLTPLHCPHLTGRCRTQLPALGGFDQPLKMTEIRGGKKAPSTTDAPVTSTSSPRFKLTNCAAPPRHAHRAANSVKPGQAPQSASFSLAINNSNCYENDPLHSGLYNKEPTAEGWSPPVPPSGRADPFPAIPHGHYFPAAAPGRKWPLHKMAAAAGKVLEAQGLWRAGGAGPRSPRVRARQGWLWRFPCTGMLQEAHGGSIC